MGQQQVGSQQRQTKPEGIGQDAKSTKTSWVQNHTKALDTGNKAAIGNLKMMRITGQIKTRVDK